MITTVWDGLAMRPTATYVGRKHKTIRWLLTLVCSKIASPLCWNTTRDIAQIWLLCYGSHPVQGLPANASILHPFKIAASKLPCRERSFVKTNSLGVFLLIWRITTIS